MKKLQGRFPDRRSVIYVYATAVFMVNGWTLLIFFWKAPSWFYYLSLGEVLSIYSYSLLIDFMESLLLVAPLWLLGAALPARWLNNHFAPYGIAWVVSIAGSAMIRLYQFRAPEMWEVFSHHQWLWWGYTMLILIALSYSFSRIGWLRKGVEQLADRLTIFLYIYLPLTAISIVVVLVRALD